MNDNQGALEDYTKAISLDPKNADLYKERSEVYRRLNEPEKAREDANKAIELSR